MHKQRMLLGRGREQIFEHSRYTETELVQAGVAPISELTAL